MTELKETLSGRMRFALVLTAILLAAAGVASYYGVRDSWTVADRPNESATEVSLATITEVALPPGPHRDEFQTSCLICHSARLVLGQPILPREKWGEVVHKMVAVYGAPMTPENEAHVVDYMIAVQGDR